MIGILAVAGLLMVAPAAAAAELFRATDVAIYDSTGKKVGTPVGGVYPGIIEVQVVFRTSRGLHFITVRRAGLSGNAIIAFAAPDCSGSPFISRATPPGRATTPGQSSSSLVGPRQTLYAPAGAFSPVSTRSHYRDDGRCVNAWGWGEFAPAASTGIDFADHFAPPFALGARAADPIPTGAVADELEPTDGLVMFDSSGKRVGPVDALIAVTDSGATVPLAVVGALYFQSSDCSGAPFILDAEWVPTNSLFPRAVGAGARKTVYVRSDEPRRQTMYSREFNGDCEIIRNWHAGGHQTFGLTGYFAPATPVGIDLADYFTEPFTTRVGRGIRSLPRPD